MASLRSTSRIATRFSSNITRISRPTSHTAPLSRVLLATSPKISQYHTTPVLHRNIPTNEAPNDAYPDGPPGEPKKGESLSSGIPPSTLYTFKDIQSISSAPDSYPDRILIDVREPSELLQTGRIPGAKNIPISTSADSFFLSAEDFEDKYGWPRPDKNHEVIFYCKAGVRSKAAARLAGQAGFGGKVGEFPGSWVEWEKNGGQVQKE